MAGFDWQRAFTAFGDGDVAALDEKRRKAAEAEENKKLNEEKLLGMTEDRKTKELSRKQAEAYLDPNSNESIFDQSRYTKDMNMFAEIPGVPKSLSDAFRKAAEEAPNKSSSQIARERESIDSLFKNLFSGQKQKSQEDEINAKINGGYFNRNKPQPRSQSSSGPSPMSSADPMKLRLTVDQNKLVGEMANDMIQEKAMDQLGPELDSLQQRDKGKWYKPDVSGPVSGRIQGLLSMFESTADPDRNKFAANLQRLFSTERKTFAGVNVTPNEMANLSPMIPDLNRDSEQTIKDKLAAARQWLANRRQTQVARLQFDKDGNPLDPSALVKSISAGSNIPAAVSADPVVERTRQAAAGASSKSAKRKAPAGSKPGDKFRSKSTGKIMVVQPDMTLSEE